MFYYSKMKLDSQKFVCVIVVILMIGYILHIGLILLDNFINLWLS